MKSRGGGGEVLLWWLAESCYEEDGCMFVRTQARLTKALVALATRAAPLVNRKPR